MFSINLVVQYYYNNMSGQYLYWDQSSRTYIPVSNENQKKQEMSAQNKKNEGSEAPANGNGKDQPKKTDAKTAKKVG